LEHPRSVALNKIGDVAFCVAGAVGEFVENGDACVLDNVSKVNDSRDESGPVFPASVCALAEGRTVVPVDRLLCGQLLVVEQVINSVL
jgi:hypothetical protein